MNRVKDIAATFTAVVAAVAVVASIMWAMWLKPEAQKMIDDSEGRMTAQVANLAGAVASRDTALVKFMAKYGVPVGPPGR